MRSSVFLGLMLTGSMAAASFMQEEAPVDAGMSLPVVRASVPARSDVPVLPLEKLARSTALEPEGNPFANKSWYVPPPLPPLVSTLKAEEPPKPEAPRLPFAYMGRIQEEGEKPVIFLTQRGEALSVGVGDEVDGRYRLESISPTELVFLYLPLNIRQTLTVGNDLATLDDSMPGMQNTYSYQSQATGGDQ